MHAIYRRAMLAILILLAASAVASVVCLRLSRLEASLLPLHDSDLPSQAHGETDNPLGGHSTIAIREDAAGRALRADFRIADDSPHPFASVALYFVDDQGRRLHLNLSRYDRARFTIRCKPANTLSLTAPTFDSRVSRRDDYVSYRAPVAHFSCHERGSQVDIDLTRLETPEWWYSMVKLDLSQKDFRLDQVPKLAFGTTFQSPKKVASTMEIADLRLEGEDRRYLYLLGGLLAAAWGGFALWFFRAHARALEADVHDRLRKDRPLVAYQQLTLAPHRDREKAAVLASLAERFADPDIELEAVAAHTGVNRNKINEILKAEFGLTFTGYLNKLRLTEAARLLSAKDTATVAEVAHAVGYNNVSYFNKLFKTEYGCTPKAFRDACTDEA